MSSEGVECEYCGEKFHPSGLYGHEQSCDENPDRFEESCQYCGETYHSPHGLSTHEKSCDGEVVEKSYECEKCGKKFSSEGYKKRHKRYCDSSSNPNAVECEHCGDEFANAGILAVHHEPCPEEIGANLTCKYCGKEFDNKGSLGQHEACCIGNPDSPYERIPFVCSSIFCNEIGIAETKYWRFQRKDNHFCSKPCARSYSTQENREEINDKVSEKMSSGDYGNVDNLIPGGKESDLPIPNPPNPTPREVIPCSFSYCKTNFSKRLGSDKKYCSRECGWADRKSSYSAIECPVCREKWVLSGKNRKYCSRKCCAKSHRRNYSEHKRSYRRACSFDFALKDYPEEFNFDLIQEHGWYKSGRLEDPNLNGVTRDHMVSVDYGWKNNIPPEIISHPANCQLMTFSENSSKNSDCSISLLELVSRIGDWEEKYG